MAIELRLAASADVDDILALHMKNHVATLGDDLSDGFLASNFTREQMEDLVEREKGVAIARGEDGELLAYATAAPWAYWSQFPFFAYLATQVPGKELDGHDLTLDNTYEYGPVCVASHARGTGLFECIFAFSLGTRRSQYPYMIAFVNERNGRSLAAHLKVGMERIGTFAYEGGSYILLACPTDMRVGG